MTAGAFDGPQIDAALDELLGNLGVELVYYEPKTLATAQREVLLRAAVEYASNNWPVFPLNGKIPAIPAIAGGRGVLDATTDVDQVTDWWGGRYRGCNIGGRIPEPMFMLDTDPYHGGLESLAALEKRNGPLPETLTDLSGRGDGGAHYFYRRPAGKLSDRRLGPGIDIKTSTGYGVLPPSIHPNTGNPYIRIERPVAAPPAWLIELLRPEKPRTIIPAYPRSPRYGHLGGSIANKFSDATSWADILGPHDWSCPSGDPDADGARWLHPTATSACSATIRHGLLFVYSTNTVFEVTEPSAPHGYTKFRAYAVLNFGGDMSAAARALKTGAR